MIINIGILRSRNIWNGVVEMAMNNTFKKVCYINKGKEKKTTFSFEWFLTETRSTLEALQQQT